MANFLLTLAEEEARTTPNHFAVRFPVDEHDCYHFADGLKQLGHSVYFVNWRDLDLFHGRFTRMFHDNLKRFVEPLALGEIDIAFLYKMEGFLLNLPRFFSMLTLLEKHCGLVVNDPATIRHNVDKRYVWDLQNKGIRIPATLPIGPLVTEKLQNGETLVLKPARGERGYGTVLANDPAALQKIVGKESDYIAQQFIPEIRQGERSLVFLGFEYQHAVLKRPPRADEEEFRCNESIGGSVEVYKPRDDELSFALAVLQAYNSLGLPVHFSRVDFVDAAAGPTLIEAHLLNPCVYSNYSNLGPQFGEQLARYLDGLLPANRTTFGASLASIRLTASA